MRPVLVAALVAATRGRSEWPALDKALAEYPYLHERELDKLRRNDPSARFILQTAYHGLGNRQRGMLSGFALALANRAAFFVDFPTTTCDREADNKKVACATAGLEDLYQNPGFAWRELIIGGKRGGTAYMPDRRVKPPRIRKTVGGRLNETDLLRTGVGALAPSLVMHVDHTLMKLIVCDKSVRASGLFPPDAFLAQRMLEARLLRPSYKVRSAVRKALSKAGGCAVGVHLRNRNRFFARRYTGPGRRALRRDRNRSESAVEPVWARIKPLVAKHNGRGVFVAADGTSVTVWKLTSGSAKYKRALEALARRDGIPVVRPPFGARNQHGGQIAALTENHILSSCDMLYPTEESSFFSIALVRAAGRKKVADQYVCGSPGNKPGAPYPFDGDRCLPGCLFNASCPSSLELDPYITTQTKSTSRALKPCALAAAAG